MAEYGQDVWPHLNYETALRAQKAAEAHLEACFEAHWEAEAEEDPDKWPDSPAVAPFCGCTTCVVREVLYAAWPILEEAR